MTIYRGRTGDSARIPLVSMLSPGADTFYAALARWLSAEALPLSFERTDPWSLRRALIERGEPAIAALCGQAYVAQRAAARLHLLVAPVPIDADAQGLPVYFSDVVVGRKSRVRAFDELRGSVFVYNELDSLSGYNAVRAHLLERGEPHGFFRAAIASGDHRSSLDMVTSGLADVAAIDSIVLAAELARRPGIADEIRVVRRLGPYPSPPIVATILLSYTERTLIGDALAHAHESELGREVLAAGGFARFVARTASDYDSIESLVQRVTDVTLSDGARRTLRWTLAARAS
jgi:phosphonate transport system substrate-binding protein